MPAYDPKKVAIGAVLVLQMVLSSVATAITVKEFKDLPKEQQKEVLAEMVNTQLEARMKSNPEQAACMDNQFFRVSTNMSGATDGALYLVLQIEKSFEKDPTRRKLEDVVRAAMNRIANTACSSI